MKQEVGIYVRKGLMNTETKRSEIGTGWSEECVKVICTEPNQTYTDVLCTWDLIIGLRLVRPSEPRLGESYFDSTSLLTAEPMKPVSGV